MTVKHQDIVGRWNIVEWVQRYDDGRVTHPLGEGLSGFVQYELNGQMFIIVAANDRPAFTTGGQWNADDREKAGAYSTVLAYAGTYELGEDQIRHHVDISLYPNWVGGTQTRGASITDGLLELTTAKLEPGTTEARVAKLSWRRVD